MGGEASAKGSCTALSDPLVSRTYGRNRSIHEKQIAALAKVTAIMSRNSLTA